METVAIVGVGLIGASFGLALRKAGFQGNIIGVSSPEAVAEAKAIGAISSTLPLADACRVADVVYLSQTVDRIVETLVLLRPHLRSDALVTDAGSIKTTIVQQASKSLPGIAFLGGHPLAGKEARGAGAADASLFEGRPYILTPALGPFSPYTREFRAYLGRMGARIVEISAQDHDEAAAFTSHLPQLLSTALAATLELAQNQNFCRVYGPGLASMTRLAMSSPEIWSPILAGNRPQVLKALDAFSSRLALLREAVATGDIYEFFRAGRSFAAQIRESKPSGLTFE
jgi:prephenate dehydrogenase